jgi:hypothetical protein
MQPIDLKARYGDTYRIQHDPAAFHEPGGRKDPRLYVIPCRRGHIYVHSDTRLGPVVGIQEAAGSILSRTGIVPGW